MKKSKIIAPALAVLTLSTAAAVTGTVAWFTASRVKNVAMTGITAVNPESGLDVVVTNVANTTVTAPHGDVKDYSVAHKTLRDSSVDVINNKVYGSVLSDAGDVVGYKEIDANIAEGVGYSAGTMGTTPIYYATAFDCAFKLSKAGGYPYNLYFDAKSSSVSTGSAATEDHYSIINALRIGIAVLPEAPATAATNYWVWAPNTREAKVEYVSGVVAAPATTEQLEAKETDYATHAIKGAGTALPTDEVVNDTTAATTVGYLNALDGTEALKALNVRIYTWFEGLDGDCENLAKDLGTAFTASLSFKMIRSA